VKKLKTIVLRDLWRGEKQGTGEGGKKNTMVATLGVSLKLREGKKNVKRLERSMFKASGEKNWSLGKGRSKE